MKSVAGRCAARADTYAPPLVRVVERSMILNGPDASGSTRSARRDSAPSRTLHAIAGLVPLAILAASALCQPCASLEGLGIAPNLQSVAAAASYDGRTIVGWTVDTAGRSRPFLWRQGEGPQPFEGPWVLNTVVASDISDEGNVITGYGLDDRDTNAAFRWTPTTGSIDLGLRGSIASNTTAVSPDGSVIVGWMQFPGAPGPLAFTWGSTLGTQFLITPPGCSSSAAGVAHRGLVTVGSITCAGRPLAVHWNPFGAVEFLGTLGGHESAATAVTSDGSTIVGWSRDPSGVDRPFRWTASTGLTPITPGRVRATGVSEHGDVIVGWTVDDAGAPRAFVWTPSRGPRLLPPDPAFPFAEALQVSGDGRVVVGRVYGPTEGERAAIWRLSCGCVADVDDGSGSGEPDGAVTIDDFLLFFDRFQQGALTADVDNGTFTAIPDGAVSIEDLLFFLERYDLGC